MNFSKEKHYKKKIASFLVCFFLLANFLSPINISADSPTAPYFELCVSPVTGGDCSGDGDNLLNEYYVGQTFDAKINLSTGGQNTKSANVIIHYDTEYLRVNDANTNYDGTQISGGDTYESYPLTGNTVSDGVIRLTGANPSGADYNGTGVFGTISFSVIKQREDMFSTSNPVSTTFDFNPGSTLDSNIVRSGDSTDILADVENAMWYLWPDVRKPFVNDINYPDGSTSVPVEANITFHFRDSNEISGDETGVNTQTLNVEIKKASGDYQSYNLWTTFSCSGTWGTNDCLVTIDPSNIGNRNWDYNTTYYVKLKDGQDRAATYQNPPGPNTMDEVNFAFTTEPDVDAPIVENNQPTGPNKSVDTNISFRIKDVKTTVPVLGTYGTGVNIDSMQIDVTNGSIQNSYSCNNQYTTCTPQIDNGLTWAYDVTINPKDDFLQNELILVTVRDATDYALPDPNKMTNFNWSFWTVDLTGPFVDRLVPADGANNILPDTKITFHINDTGVGVDINSLTIYLNGDHYSLSSGNTFSYSGDSADYAIEITPNKQFSPDIPVAISINGSDLSGNEMNEEAVYAINYDVDLGKCPSCSQSSTPQSSQQSAESSSQSSSTTTKSDDCPISQESVEKQQANLNVNVEKINDLSVVVSKIYNIFTYNKKQNVTISGTATPNATLAIHLYSSPKILTTNSDDKGNWQIATNDLEIGKHLVFAKLSKDNITTDLSYKTEFRIIPIWLIIIFFVWLFLPLVLFVIYLIRSKQKRKESEYQNDYS